ncbi:5-methyltetrahydropteroyltriglutamate--homocysteine S-methyltransferase [Georgenia daeguensis]|uniref:5-methyltetrahydropteroyltriglutamate--homocysteine S-methyltransferase n=1 Tax=Georgenia daeguensis TaxID=908355 RepID=A0ABP8EVJ5_9MICO
MPSPVTVDRTVPYFPGATVLGYPRIGPGRQLKKALEAFWSGRSEVDDLQVSLEKLRMETRRHLADLGLTFDDGAIPLDFSPYDHVLDAAVMLGAVPERFAHVVDAAGRVGPDGYFALARGDGERAPLELTKWFDSNYHYLVPEIGPGTPIRFADDRLVRDFLQAAADGDTVRPVVVGPLTFLLLSKPAEGSPKGFHPLDRLDDVLAAYADLLRAFGDAGAPWVQLDEPALVVDTWDVPRERVLAALSRGLETLAGDLARPARPALFLAAPYGDLGDALPLVADSHVEAVGLDLVRGPLPRPEVLRRLAGKVVVGGVVDGRNVWRTDLERALDLLQRLSDGIGEGARVGVSTSCSLLHVPHDASRERRLGLSLRPALAFADQKVEEVQILARGLALGAGSVRAELAAAGQARDARTRLPGVRRDDVAARVAALTEPDLARAPYEERSAAQAATLRLPALPTTTIGSFPQTAELRRARVALKKHDLDREGYERVVREEIARVVRLQEELGLDVLVHGEPERNDMVQFFAEQLDGFAVTDHGWVQSYGSRCTRPPILWGDVARRAPMTLPWTAYAASLTDRPVKAVVTGPVTMLAWSFVRDDQPLAETAQQVALALRDEIADLQDAGIRIVQVDEPALRELLPLRRADREEYLAWAVRAFRVATAVAGRDTQVHTHLCYSEFGDILDAIDAMDADVTSIEAARSRMEILPGLRAAGFCRGVGPGVYDIHSPRVPTTEEVAGLLTAALAAVPAGQLWVNPDCGLKTRSFEEATAALTNLVQAARAVRATL